MSEPEAVLPLPADAEATLTRLLAQWVDRHRLADEGPAATARILAVARASQVAPAEPFGYDWWRTLLAPMEQALRAIEEVTVQAPHAPATWPLSLPLWLGS